MCLPFCSHNVDHLLLTVYLFSAEDYQMAASAFRFDQQERLCLHPTISPVSLIR
jgi:hypothetical protein